MVGRDYADQIPPHIPHLELSALDLSERSYRIISRWLARGDGVAVYENQDFGHPEYGHRQMLSFGSKESQIVGAPPEQLPDFPGKINWRYRLVGWHIPPPLFTEKDACPCGLPWDKCAGMSCLEG